MFFDIAIFSALLLDQFFGDPRWFPHPVRTIGALCTFLESKFRPFWSNQKIAGAVTVACVVALTVLFTSLLVYLSFKFSHVAGYIVSILILYTTLAAKDLVKHSKVVYRYLHPHNDIENARKAVGMIVGRDTADLSSEGVSKACVETVAENMVDGVTAPLFYGVLSGVLAMGGVEAIGAAAVGAMTYKAINTMDSMFGYKNEKYIHFGTVAARLDDIVNFLPARLTGLILIPTAAVMGLNWKDTWRIYLRDRLAHASPNAAHPEAAVAGALGIQLAGDSSYFGKVVSKPKLGDSKRKALPTDILTTNRMMLLGSLLFTVGLLLLKKIVEVF